MKVNRKNFASIHPRFRSNLLPPSSGYSDDISSMCLVNRYQHFEGSHALFPPGTFMCVLYENECICLCVYICVTTARKLSHYNNKVTGWRVQAFDWVKRFFYTVCVANPATYPTGTGSPFPGTKAIRA
jgi:hypothetical protein